VRPVYQADDRDGARRLTHVPQSDVGAPIQPAPIEMPRIVGAAAGGSLAVVSFRRMYASSFGPPNDDAFAAHPPARDSKRSK